MKKNAELLKLMSEYSLFMSSKKQMEMPFVVSHEKPNHKTSLYKEQSLTTTGILGNITIDCEIRNKDPHNYSFQILSDKLASKILARFDEGNGTHRNNLPNIPLSDQQVTTPHFHKYDEMGRFVAYKTPSIGIDIPKKLSIYKGFCLFCNEESILSSNNEQIYISVQEAGTIPFDLNEDPLSGINF